MKDKLTGADKMVLSNVTNDSPTTDEEKAIAGFKDNSSDSSSDSLSLDSLSIKRDRQFKNNKFASSLNGLSYKDIFPIATDEKSKKFTKDFLQNVLEILWIFIRDTNDREKKVLDFHQPEQLMNIMDFSLPDHPQNLEQILADCSATLRHQVKTGHPHFLNQLSQGLDVISMAGEWLAATANTNMFTYEIAPVFIMMEHEVLNKMREIIGFHAGDSILAPGGSISNMYALIIARHRFFPQHKHQGMRAIKEHLIVYTSEECHYSIRGGCATIGLGLDNCWRVSCDERSSFFWVMYKLFFATQPPNHTSMFVHHQVEIVSNKTISKVMNKVDVFGNSPIF